MVHLRLKGILVCSCIGVLILYSPMAMASLNLKCNTLYFAIFFEHSQLFILLHVDFACALVYGHVPMPANTRQRYYAILVIFNKCIKLDGAIRFQRMC